jgi:hypothetical protein
MLLLSYSIVVNALFTLIDCHVDALCTEEQT